jgi:hypothetical protein
MLFRVPELPVKIDHIQKIMSGRPASGPAVILASLRDVQRFVRDAVTRWPRRGAGRDRRHSPCAAGGSCFHHQDGPQRGRPKGAAKEFSMSKFAIGERVDNAADNHEGGTIIAVFPTVEGNFRYAVDTEGYGALKFFNEEKLVRHLH